MVNPARVYTLNRRRAFRGAPTGDVETTWYNTQNGYRVSLTHSVSATVASIKAIAFPQLLATPIEDYTPTTRPNDYEDALVPDSDTFAQFGITLPTTIYVQDAPTTPPQVQNLQAPTVTDSAVILTWDANPPAGWGAVYSVERKTGVGGEWGVLDTVSAPTYTDDTVASETTYFYRVNEYVPNSPFIGAYSSELQVDTLAPIEEWHLTWLNTQTGQRDDLRVTPRDRVLRDEKINVLVDMGYDPSVESAWGVGTRPGRGLDQEKTIRELLLSDGATLYMGYW